MSRFDDRYLNYGDVYSIIVQAKTVDQAMNVLHLPYVEMPRWIPVTERLPEDTGKYLVTVKNGNVYAGTYDKFSRTFQCAATAWQPLPKPFEGAD